MKTDIPNKYRVQSAEYRIDRRGTSRRVTTLVILPLLFGALIGFLFLARGQQGSFPQESIKSPKGAVQTVVAEIPATGRTTIELRSEESGSPLPDSTVRYLLEGSRTIHEAVTDQEGKIALPTAGRYLLDISADGHVGVRGVYTIDPQGSLFTLSRSGSLEIRFVDEQGYPMETMDALLLPPVEKGPRWGNRWNKKFNWNALETYDYLFEELLASDDAPSEPQSNTEKRRMKILFSGDPRMDKSGKRIIPTEIRAASRRMHWRKLAADSGRALWTELPEGDGYRWGLLSEQNLVISPEHEDQGKEYIPSGNGWKPGNKPPVGLSGMFSIRAGETTRLTVRIYSITSIRGILVPGMGTFVKPAKVRLHDRRIMTHEGISPLSLVEQAAAVKTDAEGRFFFEGVTPGRKQVKAVWVDQNQNVYLYKVVFDVPEGSCVDLGMIHPKQGESLRGVVDFRDNHGMAVQAGEIFEKDGNLRAVLTLNNLNRNTPDHLRLLATVQLEVEKPFTIHGLAEGTWRLQAQEGYYWPSPQAPYLRIGSPSEIKLEMPGSGDVALSFPVEMGMDVQVHVNFPEGSIPVRLAGKFRSLTSDRTYPFNVGPGQGVVENKLIGRFRIPADRYQIHLRSGFNLKSPDSTGFYVKEQVYVVEYTREIHVSAVSGAAIEGKLLCAHGHPVKKKAVVFRSKNGTSYNCRTDLEGNFKVLGMEPFEELTSDLSKSRIRSGNAGSRRKVELMASVH